MSLGESTTSKPFTFGNLVLSKSGSDFLESTMPLKPPQVCCDRWDPCQLEGAFQYLGIADVRGSCSHASHLQVLFVLWKGTLKGQERAIVTDTPPLKTITWRLLENPPWMSRCRCISYWRWEFSNVMLVFRGVYTVHMYRHDLVPQT